MRFHSGDSIFVPFPDRHGLSDNHSNNTLGAGMRKTVLVYGLISGGVIIATMCGNDRVWKIHSYWIGYLVMVVALSAMFFGVKSYRDNTLGGVIKFKTAFLVGLLITLVASVVYVAGWEVYLAVSNDDFMEQYTHRRLKS